MKRTSNNIHDARARWGTLAALAVVIALIFPGNHARAKAEPQLIFEAEGQSHVKNNNFMRGRALAVDYAFKNALEMALKDILGRSTFRSQRKTLKKMLRHPKKFIKQYRYLEMYDSPVEQLSRVKLEVVFFPEAINRELSTQGILSSLVRPRTALVLILEKSLSVDAQPEFWEYVPISEVAMLQKFLAAGVKVTPREKISELVDEQVVLDAIQGDLDAAVDIGLKARTDIVIVGTAVTTQVGNRTAEGLTTIQANLTLRAVSTTQSTIIAARSDFASVNSQEEFKGELQAFEVVGKKMAAFFL
ncbi:MAG: DUF2066 domain-containing protein, partial [Nitrospinaceae bacterium]|nr:DUF2066 domain-containing protein [Nitrospinaceae bacterium]NIR53611.1 DUF2066 domain-containing protein [Nitrospinaceae bacterium]NIS84014.1 DUF2066 domain-containing protein [Nitrospinaceae bacterium]NIT80819.1 DUF2066 domain-containing protein [Nitrospinaceae bacterium]NIU43127.1 DUF2066 domain-containing protein [Nitrospinaceae bacterium]